MALKLETERLPGSKLEIRVQADAAEVEKAYDRVFSHLAEEARIPGFRPGHAPRAILERRFSEEDLRRLAWQEFLESSFAPELEKLEVEPLGEPDIPDLEENEGFQRGQDFSMTTTLMVHPEPDLPDYHALKLVRPSAEVTEEDVDEHLQRLRLAHAKREKVDREVVQAGDIVAACVHIHDAEGDKELEHYDAELKADPDSKNEVEKHLVGAKQGETVEYEMTLTEPQEDPALVGQKVKVSALVEEIREVILPELDADFAKAVEDSLDSVEALREYVKERLTEQFAAESDRAVRSLAMAVVDRGTRMELPEKLVRSMTSTEMSRYNERLQMEGLSSEAALEMLQDRETGLFDQAAMSAVEGLRLHYIFEAIAKAEDLEPGEEEINAALAEYAKEYGLEEGNLRQMVAMQPETEAEFHEQATRRMVIDKLLADAEIDEVSREGYPLMARRLLEEATERQKPAAPPAVEPEAAADTSAEGEAPEPEAEASEAQVEESGETEEKD
jgi:trigger factor